MRLCRPGFVARDTWSVLGETLVHSSSSPCTTTLGVMSLSLEDVQSRVPTLSLSLSRVGVTNVEKVIRIRANGSEQLFSARQDCFVDLGPHQKGAHMSRFEEVVNDAIGEVVLGESAFRAETLAAHIAEKVRDRQGARRARGPNQAPHPPPQPAPLPGVPTPG